MIIAHAGKQPQIDPTAWIAPGATICGDVTVGAGARILHGACVIAEAGGSITIGSYCIVMENAVVRAGPAHPCRVADHCLIGPVAHVVGATLDEQVFVATASQIFHGAELGQGSEVRVRGTVHLRSRLAPGQVVPIGWIAVGNPARILPPEQHEEIWKIQQPLHFPQWVYGIDRETPDLMRVITRRLSEKLGAHSTDTVLEDSCR